MHDHDISPFLVRAHIPGDVSLTEEALAALWYRLSGEGLTDALFYDGGVRCAGDFINFMCAPDVYCYAVYADDLEKVPLAVTWLNNFSGRAAMIHFAVFKAGTGCKTAIGRFVVDFMLHARVPACPVGHAEREGGDAVPDGGTSGYCLDALYGMTPRPYAHVLRFVRRLGFQVQGIIPGAVRMHMGPETGNGRDGCRHVDGVISVCTRDSLACGVKRVSDFSACP